MTYSARISDILTFLKPLSLLETMFAADSSETTFFCFSDFVISNLSDIT